MNKRELPEGVYRLRLYAYCGMSYNLVDEGEMGECREAAAQAIRHHRNELGYPVSTLEPGREWELITGDDAVAIGDTEGTLKIVGVTGKCRDCGDHVNVFHLSDGICDSCRQLIDDFDLPSPDRQP
jgi:hypothetical protein